MCIFYQFSLILFTESVKWIVMLCVYICHCVSIMKLLNIQEYLLLLTRAQQLDCVESWHWSYHSITAAVSRTAIKDTLCILIKSGIRESCLHKELLDEFICLVCDVLMAQRIKILHHVFWYIWTNFLEECAASIFTVKMRGWRQQIFPKF